MHALLRPTAALRRLGVQWAFVAVLALALMPSLSRWMAPTGPSDWAAICQAAPSGPGSTAPQGDRHGDACALCSLAHATPVIGAAANIAFRTELIARAGYFDTRLGRSGGGATLLSNEEIDLAARIPAARLGGSSQCDPRLPAVRPLVSCLRLVSSAVLPNLAVFDQGGSAALRRARSRLCRAAALGGRPGGAPGTMRTIR